MTHCLPNKFNIRSGFEKFGRFKYLQIPNKIEIKIPGTLP